MKHALLLSLVLAVVLVATPVMADDIYVGPDPGDDHTTIQAAINAANPTGDTIYVAPGIYNERPVANKSVTIIGTGADETFVIIDAGAATSGSYGFSVSADNVSVSNLTLVGDTSLSTPRYGFKPSSVSNFTLIDVTAKEFYRTGVDLLGVTNGVLTNITSIDNNGHGISFCDCNGVVVTNLDVSGNAWQGVSVATWGDHSPLGTSGIVFQGTNSFADPFQLEMGDISLPGVPPSGEAVITYSTNPADLADVTVLASDFGYAVHGEQDDGPDQVRIWFAPTLVDAALLPAMAPIGHFNGNDMYIESLTDATQLYATPGCEIQAAVDAASSGDDINITAGTYREQIKIDGKSLDLVGPIVGTAVVEAVDVIDRTTYSVTQWTGTSGSIDACIGVVGPATVNISDLTVDGRELGPDNFYGVHFFDVNGSVTDCRIEDVVYTADPGASKIVSLAASQSDAVASYTIEFSDNVIPNFQKCGILVMGPDFTFTVDGNEITDVPSDIIAGNGIQLSYGATGTMSDNVVQGVGYTGGDWSGSGILLFESGSISMDGDEVLDCETGVAFDDWGWIHVHPSQVALDFVDLNLHDNAWTLGVALSRDGSDVDVDIIDCIVADSAGDGIDLYGTGVDPWGGVYYTGLDNGSLVARISGCTITNAAGDGIWVDDLSGNATNTIDVSVNQTGLSGNVNSALWNGQSDEVDAEYCWWGDPAGPTVIRDGGARQAAPRVSPYGADLPDRGESRYVDSGISRAGDGVHGVVDYTPWLSGNIVCDLDPEYLTAAVPTKTVAVKYLGGGSGDVFGYSIKFSWDSAVVSTTTGDINEGSLLSDLGGTFFYAAPGTGDEIVVDCALLGSIAGATGPGTLFTVDFTGLAVGTSDIDVEILNVRDQYNNPLSGFYEDDGLLIVDVSVPTIAGVAITNTTLGHTNDYVKDTDGVQVTATVLDDDPTFGAGDIVADLSGFGIVTPANPGSYNWTTGAAVWTIVAPTGVTCSPANGDVWVYVDATDAIGNPAAQGSDDIIADNTPPTAVTNLDAAPGHQKCDLSWTMGSDTYLDGVVVQRNANVGDYPVYPLFVAAWPVVTPYYPATHLLGTNVYTGAAAVATDAVIDRNIYYYQAFCFDIARNYGAADVSGLSADLATNYWLGDVASTLGSGIGFYNGLVNDADINELGLAYHAAPGGSPVDEMDVGPTVHPNYGRLGLPTPDNFVGFEDLMMFAMNYGMVIPRVVPLLSEPVEGQLALSLEQMSSDAAGVVELALRLEGNVGDVKGISAVFELEGMEFVSARLSDEMSSPAARTFLWAGDNQIDLAILGTDVSIGGSGELARLTFQATSEEYAVGFASATLRGVENGVMDADLEGYISKDDIPATFKLVQNAPNPFNPMTTIAFNVPHESRVAIRVYDVSGRVVRTLVDGVTEPGRHAAVWDGRNDHGESCGSGVYFCVMETPEYRGSSKMMLLK